MKRYDVVEHNDVLATIDANGYLHAVRKLAKMKEANNVGGAATLREVKRQHFLITSDQLQACVRHGCEVVKKGTTHSVVLAYDIPVQGMRVPQGITI